MSNGTVVPWLGRYTFSKWRWHVIVSVNHKPKVVSIQLTPAQKRSLRGCCLWALARATIYLGFHPTSDGILLQANDCQYRSWKQITTDQQTYKIKYGGKRSGIPNSESSGLFQTVILGVVQRASVHSFQPRRVVDSSRQRSILKRRQ